MRKVLVILFLLSISFMLISALPVSAAVTGFSGTLDQGDPTYPDAVPDNFPCTSLYFPEEAPFWYEVLGYTAPVTGDYLYYNEYDGDRLIDVVVSVYPTGGFNPAAPLDNCLYALDDEETFSLTSGDYQLVVTSYYEGDLGDYYFEITSPDVAAPACPNPLPADSVLYQIPAGAPTFYEPSLGAQTTFDLPAGTWYISEFSGDFAKVWIACQANPVWVPSNAVAH